MIEDLRVAIVEYQQKWQAFANSRSDAAFFGNLRPTSVAWKTTDLADFTARAAKLHEISTQVHFGWVNERWLATFYLKEPLPLHIRLVKLMQRRPGSTDAVGLDHLDFYIPDGISAKDAISKEQGVQWTEEKNGEHCKWLSIWFDGTEAKLRSDTVLEVCAAEMKDAEKQVLS